MKKIFQLIGIVIVFPIMYITSISIAEVIYSISYLIKNKIPVNHANIIASQAKVINETSIIVLISSVILLIILFLIFSKTKKNLINYCSFKKLNLNTFSLIILLGIGLSILDFLLVSTLSNLLPSYKYVSNSVNSPQYILLNFIVITVFTPIFEEIIFRGVIFGFLKNNFNIIVAIIVQALSFSIAHGNIVQSIYTFTGGIVFSLIYMHSDSIFGPILLHMVGNLLGAFVLPEFFTYFPNTNSLLLFLFAIICIILASMQILKKYESQLYKQ